MHDVVFVYTASATDASGAPHTARACARERERGRWEVWFEFEPVGGGAVARTPVETTQSDRDATERWASGISRVYLEGALARASAGEPPAATARPIVELPAEREAVLDPSEVIAGGEEHLRHRLDALSTAHLRDVAREQRTLSAAAVDGSSRDELVAAIVAQTRGT